MEQITTRLKETSEQCLKCYEAWKGEPKNNAAREALQEAVHELRKVASRLEIEIAVSERNEVTQRAIPIPSHRDSQRRGKPQDDDNNIGNQQESEGRSHQSGDSGPRRRTLQRRSAGGGSGHGHGGGGSGSDNAGNGG